MLDKDKIFSDYIAGTTIDQLKAFLLECEERMTDEDVMKVLSFRNFLQARHSQIKTELSSR